MSPSAKRSDYSRVRSIDHVPYCHSPILICPESGVHYVMTLVVIWFCAQDVGLGSAQQVTPVQLGVLHGSHTSKARSLCSTVLGVLRKRRRYVWYAPRIMTVELLNCVIFTHHPQLPLRRRQPDICDVWYRYDPPVLLIGAAWHQTEYRFISLLHHRLAMSYHDSHQMVSYPAGGVACFHH